MDGPPGALDTGRWSSHSMNARRNTVPVTGKASYRPRRRESDSTWGSNVSQRERRGVQLGEFPVRSASSMTAPQCSSPGRIESTGTRTTGWYMLTICLAAMHTVLIVNLRPHISKRSSRFGPSRSMTRTLCKPS